MFSRHVASTTAVTRLTLSSPLVSLIGGSTHASKSDADWVVAEEGAITACLYRRAGQIDTSDGEQTGAGVFVVSPVKVLLYSNV